LAALRPATNPTGSVMAYQFQAIDISVFDFHLTLAPLLNPNSVNKDYQFLVDPAAYNQYYTAGTPIKTKNLILDPLDWWTLNYHHFWRYYQTIWPLGSSYDFWKLQMPFIGKLAGQQLKVNTGSPNFIASIRPRLFVNGFGWSTNFDIALRGNMTPAQVTNFVGRLGDKNVRMFELNGIPKTLPELFEHFGQSVQQELYAPQVINFVKINRHMLMTVASFTGPVAPYRDSGNEIPTADRAWFHSMLKGTKVGFAEVLDLENNKFLLTQFHDRPDFAISYFDYGTLLFMQQTALDAMTQGRVHRSKAKCHSSNIRNYLLTTLDHYVFWRDAKKTAGASPAVKTMRDDALITLQEIPNKYNNQFCKSFHTNFGPLTKNKS
jgi:hypothetical protein